MVLERPDLLGLHLPHLEIREDRALGFLVHLPFAVHPLGDADLAAVERADDLLDPLRRKLAHSACSRISPARRHSASVGTSAIRQ